MASSPTEERLLAIAAAYDEALDRLQCADLDKVQVHLDEVDRIHARLRSQKTHDPVPAELVERIERAHGTLCSLISAALHESKGSIQRSMDGRRALQSYGRRTPTGGRVSSEF